MKKLLMAIAILTTAFTFNACNGGGGDPKAVLINFFEALGKKDIEGARKLATAESKSMLDMMEMGLKMAKDSTDMNKYDKNKMEFGDAKIEGEKATVAVKDKVSGETTNFSLKKESGAWKVAFDKASMMQMGMEKMNEKKNDSLGTSEMNSLNMDSLTEAMDKGLKAVDSTLKNMNAQ
ncbi:MAG: hypothetical protein V4556_09860 [Bacteroidota bacterium]